MSELLTDALRTTTDQQFQADWTRQRRTAADILRRLRSQEGVILADQVGMGKTYVALTVAVNQVLSTRELGQVVVFVPPAVADKWVREWRKFSESLLEPGTGIRCVETPLRSGEEFLKALDDPPERRNHLVVVTHTALTTTLKDTFIQLALLHYATRSLRGGEGARLRGRIAKWSTKRTGLLRNSSFRPEHVAVLLDTNPKHWRSSWERLTGETLTDDPVPAALGAAVGKLDLAELREVLRSLPVRASADIGHRLERARKELARATQSTWRVMLSSTDIDLPLLIVDEAHRLKNSSTLISKLFAQRSEHDETAGALAGIFRRMLFLTATPFELGHSELINVLSRAGAIRPMMPPPPQPLAERLEELGKVLTAAQASALSLDNAWGRLEREELSTFDTWAVELPSPGGVSNAAREAWEHARLATRARREMHQALRPWIIRHGRPHRRDYFAGNAILGSRPPVPQGLEISEASALPFLLAARAQSVAIDESGPARPLFAYGIASSYEAFTRLGPNSDGDPRDSDLGEDERESEGDAASMERASLSDPVGWYRSEVRRALEDPGVLEAHPKVSATVEKATALWQQGDKCLMFCWFIRTGEAVERALAKSIDQLILARAATALGSEDEDATRMALDRVSDRLFRRDTPSYDRLRFRLRTALAEAVGDHPEVADLVTDAAVRHIRTPNYLVRFTPLGPEMSEEDVWDGINAHDAGSRTLIERWREFAHRLAKARESATTLEEGEGHDSEFARMNAALLGIQADDETARRGASLHPVRRASGQTDRHVRERLIALFNTPFAPDLLVASSVMGEGIDLHQECRYVIHHDLDWNPSVLEQRTGRLDRIGALAEREHKNIEVFEPFLAGTHDEKMFRVVKDRAQWFDVVMGRASGSDEHTTDAEESRLPLHDRIRRALTMDLRSPGALE